MIVKAKEDYSDYGEGAQIREGNLYIVFAIEEREGEKNYYLLSANHPTDEQSELDPRQFNSDLFDIVADQTSERWTTDTVRLWNGEVKYSSFPEWFVGDFHIRAHDWNLDDDDYGVMRKYTKQYQELYKDILDKLPKIN